MQETQVQSLGWEDPLEEAMTTHYSILAWKIPWTEGPGGLQSMRPQSQTWLSDWTHTHVMLPTECLCPPLTLPKSYVDTLTLSVMVFGVEYFRGNHGYRRSQGWGPHNGLVPLYEASELASCLSVVHHVRTQEDSRVQTRKSVLTKHQICQYLDLGLPSL